LEEYYKSAHELKVVVFNKHDFKWAEEHAHKMHPQAELFLQVEWDQRAKMLPQIIEYIKTHPKWRLSVQTHKYIGIP